MKPRVRFRIVADFMMALGIGIKNMKNRRHILLDSPLERIGRLAIQHVADTVSECRIEIHESTAKPVVRVSVELLSQFRRRRLWQIPTTTTSHVIPNSDHSQCVAGRNIDLPGNDGFHDGEALIET